MSTFNIAWIEAVNGANSHPRLSIDDLWQGCVLLARSPQLFTSAISACDIPPIASDRFTRTLHFHQGAVDKMEQEVTLVDRHKFECTTIGTGNRVTTMIFHGVSETPEDLYLSLEYSIPYGKVSLEGEEGEKFREMYRLKAKENLVTGLATMRDLKSQGKLA
ncbi:SRPBCC family protein [Aspergillus thermomutatus]|uniref:DUF1857-domain-containing protein n=1 Tax=Aspergillus thermomutatus TaxID=41047 RepID=A0A397H2D4_ASPTH|nr:uncharacterized protein CDV56_103889 [Aspergillus thermomutatus]RHZ55543.1 hypothetical protein CDV56_103889 [Aspergillus thermomutatus]